MSKVLCSLALLAPLLAGCQATTPIDATPTGSIAAETPKTGLDARIAYYAALYDIPESLIRRSIKRESGGNPKARNGPYWGLMQIRYDTARGMGYRGSPAGLLDADTNLKYAGRYLANAWIVANGNPDRAIALYAGGYYYEARRKGMLEQMRTAEIAPSTTQAGG